MRHLLAALLLSGPIHALAQAPGDLDSTFSGDGMLFLDSFPAPTSASLVRAQTDYVLIAGSFGSNSTAIRRLKDDGSLDTSYGTNGLAQIGSHRCDDVQVLNDGSILVIGKRNSPQHELCVSKLSEHGEPDTTYGVSGGFSFPATIGFVFNNAFRQSDDRLLISLTKEYSYPLPDTSVLIRLLPTGVLDTSFAQVGFLNVTQHGRIYGVACSNDGRVLVAFKYAILLISSNGTFPPLVPHYFQTFGVGEGDEENWVPLWVNDLDIVMSRYVWWGIDGHSSYAGIKTVDVNSGDILRNGIDTWAPNTNLLWSYYYTIYPWYGNVTSSTMDPTGAFFAAGAYSGAWTSPWRIWRFDPSGTRDSSFATNGLLETTFSAGEPAMPMSNCAQPDGKLVVLGSATIGGVNHSVICRYHNIPDPRAKLSAHVFLGGPYDAVVERMSDGLRTNNLLPTTSPYQALGYSAIGSSDYQTMHSGVIDFTGDSAIVDWVWVELLGAPDVDSVAAARAALVRRDGLIVGMDGRSPVDFNCGSGSYYVRIRHRNHLGVTASDPVVLSATSTAVDFTSVLTNTFGSNAQDEINGKRMLWPGDVTSDGTVKYVGAANDRDAILLAIGGVNTLATVTAYDRADVNLDGTIKYAGLNNDRDRVLLAIGGTSPTAVRVEQVP